MEAQDGRICHLVSHFVSSGILNRMCDERKPIPWRLGWLLLILLAAAFLRLAQLADAPPGMTHDEADHGLTAWEIVNGRREIYFTVGYGREPLYDYVTAGVMALIGPTYLAGRLTAVAAGLLLVAVFYAWVRRAFGERTALLTAAGVAVSFWPVMTSRQALRSSLLPALFALAVYFFWRGVSSQHFGAVAGFPHRARSGVQPELLQVFEKIRQGLKKLPGRSSPAYFITAGLFLGLTFYVYIPARILWVALPAVLVYQAYRVRPFPGRAWVGLFVSLVVAGLVAWPLLNFLAANPGVEARITELSAPLKAALAGDFQLLWSNLAGSLRLFAIEGDSAWRYNISGKPFLPLLWGGLFYLGVVTAAWRAIRPGGDVEEGSASLLALVWLAAGLAPVLVTGPELATTQAVGMQPVLYLFPALALIDLSKAYHLNISGLWPVSRPRHTGHGRETGPSFPKFLRRYSKALKKWGAGEPGRRRDGLLRLLCSPAPLLLFFGVTAVFTFRDYFITWANAPEVRVQYESTMMAVMDYLNDNGAGATAVSTITPGPFHSQAVARLAMHNEQVSLRWFNATGSLLLPDAGQSSAILPGFTPLAPALADYFETAVLVQTLPLRPTDLDRPIAIYRLDGRAMQADWRRKFTGGEPVSFGGRVEFLGYDLPTKIVSPGGVVELATWWRVLRPLPDALLFTHVQGENGAPIAQADRLDVPGESWQTGDQFIQLHTFLIPPDTAVGEYPVAIGLCQKSLTGCARLKMADGRDLLPLLTLTVTP